LKLFQEWGRGDKRIIMEEVNSTMKHCKNFVSVTMNTKYTSNMILKRTIQFKKQKTFLEGSWGPGVLSTAVGDC
jgi:hypothetical protein